MIRILLPMRVANEGLRSGSMTPNLQQLWTPQLNRGVVSEAKQGGTLTLGIRIERCSRPREVLILVLCARSAFRDGRSHRLVLFEAVDVSYTWRTTADLHLNRDLNRSDDRK